MFSPQFRALAQEGHLSSNALLAGFEGVATSDFDRPGTIYAALFNLATGLERMMKLIFIVEHKASNNLANPTPSKLRKFSHSLIELYEWAKAEGEVYGITDSWYSVQSTHYDVLAFLSDFALGTRYHNLDTLVGAKESVDPLIRWFELHMEIAKSGISQTRQEKLMTKCREFCERNSLLGWQVGFRGQYDLQIDIIFQHALALRSRGHCVWLILEIIKPLYRLLDRLCVKVDQLERSRGDQICDVPYLIEFFPFGLTTREAALRRKAWSRLFVMAGRF
jgi:hypothetical protein